jgi:hypothetical protein
MEGNKTKCPAEVQIGDKIFSVLMVNSRENLSEQASSTARFHLAKADATAMEENDLVVAQSPERAGQIIGGRYILPCVLDQF